MRSIEQRQADEALAAQIARLTGLPRGYTDNQVVAGDFAGIADALAANGKPVPQSISSRASAQEAATRAQGRKDAGTDQTDLRDYTLDW